MSDFISPRYFGVTEKLAFFVRKKIYASFFSYFNPSSSSLILDIGVTSDRSRDSNFFEKLYPFKSQITAIGLEDASFLEDEYPGLKFLEVDAKYMPFDDSSFDLGFCSAVIEHVGSRDDQYRLLCEISRVCKSFIITTPNKWFPIELHTFTLLLHWLPANIFRKYLRIIGNKFFSEEKNLNLLTKAELINWLRVEHIDYSESHIKLFGCTSNLVFLCARK